jgi:hypothetical protein
MSIAGYLTSRNNTELRMPKSGVSSSNRGKNTQEKNIHDDTQSIRYQGPVLTGEKSVEQGQRDDVIRAASHRGNLYSRVVDRDLPLREHPPAAPGTSVLPSESRPRKSGPEIIWKHKRNAKN